MANKKTSLLTKVLAGLAALAFLIYLVILLPSITLAITDGNEWDYKFCVRYDTKGEYCDEVRYEYKAKLIKNK